MEDPQQGTRGIKEGRQESGEQKPRKHCGSLLVTSQVTDIEGAGCWRCVWRQAQELSPRGAPAPSGWGERGGADRRERGGGGGEPRALAAGALTALRAPRPAFPVHAGHRTVQRSREVWGERARAGSAGARLRGGDGSLRGAWVSICNWGTGRTLLTSGVKGGAVPAQLHRAWTWWAAL